MNRKFTGYVLSTSVYKETNLIVNLLTINGIVSFKAVGALKVPYKLNGVVSLYAKVNVELVSSKDEKRYVLIGGEKLDKNNFSYDETVLLSFVSEAIIKDNADTLNYDFFENIYNNLNKKQYYGNIILFILKNMLYKHGCLLESECCAHCGSTSNIISVSFKDGGFLCSNCYSKFNAQISNIAYLKGYRYMVRAKIENIYSFTLEKETYRSLINNMIIFLENNAGIKFISYKLLLTII